ncbi:MAG TPA: ABC transporter ATP-binding protein [Asanoa sp.]|jgi:peptide/nickel transport system ATP-binding protein|nr:ABC transporter ATP-binding protein [Asanoa sp.]
MTDRLEVTDLRVTYATESGPLHAVNGMSFTVGAGEIVALVGESGCGKSATAMSVLRLLPPNAEVAGSIKLEGRELTGLSTRQLREIRGRDVSMVFQEPMTALNPSFTIGFQIREVILRHQKVSRRQAHQRAIELLDLVRMPAAARRMREYPHQLSGGMRQRVVIAMAVACRPKVLIADEPTTALDVTIQAQILDIIRSLVAETGTSVVLITHDLGVVADMADRVEVMYAGHRVESGRVAELFAAPRHPYTARLLAAVPRRDRSGRLQEIPGRVPTLRDQPHSCVFAPRCHRADDRCRAELPVLEEQGHGQLAACFHPEAAGVTEGRSA